MRKIILYILLLSFTLSVMCGGFYASAAQETDGSALYDIMTAHESEISIWFRNLPEMYHYKYTSELTAESEYGFYGSYIIDLPNEYSDAIYSPEEQIVTLKSDVTASGELRYVKIWNPLDKNGQYIGPNTYTDPEVKKKFLTWDEFLILLDEIFTQSAKNALLSSFIFKEQDGCACMVLPSLFWYRLYINRGSERKSDFRSAENLEILAQRDNVAYLKAHPDYANATVGSLWVYEYDADVNKWLLAYTDYIFIPGLYSGDKTFKGYEGLAPYDFSSTNGNYVEKAEEVLNPKDTVYGFGLTDTVIENLMSGQEKQLMEMLLKYSPYPFQNPSSREIVKLDEYGIAWCKLYNPFSDGTFIGYQGAVQNSFINSGEQYWSDWEAALLNVFSKDVVTYIKQNTMISEDGYICVKTTTNDEGGGSLPSCIKDAYKFLGFYNDCAIIERYADDFNAENYNEGVPSDKDILILKNENDQWKILYYQGLISDTEHLRALFENENLTWLGEYIYGEKRKTGSHDFDEWFNILREDILRHINGETIPETSDSTLNLSITTSISSAIVAFICLINRRKNYEK